MTNAVAEKVSYEIQGYYFGENHQITTDTHFHYSDSDSMIDHQKAWYEDALKNGHQSGELDEAHIIKANYKGDFTNEQIMAIVNDPTLMNAPFRKLFPAKINGFLIGLFESEYADLESYVLQTESEKDCSEELARMNTIQKEISRLTFHGD
jgi:hypothetical protein